MAKLFYDSDADLGLLQDKTVAIIGYGSQGHAHALNLKDSGIKVVVGLYEGSRSASKATSDGLEVLSVAEASERADWIMILLPDEFQKDVYAKEIAPHLKAGKILSFAHGFNIRFELIKPICRCCNDCSKGTRSHCQMGVSKWARGSSFICH